MQSDIIKSPQVANTNVKNVPLANAEAGSQATATPKTPVTSSAESHNPEELRLEVPAKPQSSSNPGLTSVVIIAVLLCLGLAGLAVYPRLM